MQPFLFLSRGALYVIMHPIPSQPICTDLFDSHSVQGHSALTNKYKKLTFSLQLFETQFNHSYPRPQTGRSLFKMQTKILTCLMICEVGLGQEDFLFQIRSEQLLSFAPLVSSGSKQRDETALVAF